MSDSFYARSPLLYLRVLANYARDQFSPPATRPHVVMVHTGRSGSTVIGDTLYQRPDFHWDHEILLAKRFQRYAPLLPFLRPYIVADPLRVVHWRKLLASREKTYGFDVMPHQLERFEMEVPEFVDRLHAYGIDHVIILERKNALRIVVSYYRAMQQSQWHVGDRKELSGQKPFELPLADVFGYGRNLLENLEYYSAFAATTLKALAGKPLLHLTYEDDIAPDPLIAYERICRFLGLPEYEVSVRLHKINPQPLSHMITNYDEVVRTLAGTSFEWMTTE